MKLSFVAFSAALAALFVVSSPQLAQAHDYPWCVASQHGTAQDCLFRTKAQCDAAASGYGICIRNYAVPEMTEETPQPKKRVAKKKIATKPAQ